MIQQQFKYQILNYKENYIVFKQHIINYMKHILRIQIVWKIQKVFKLISSILFQKLKHSVDNILDLLETFIFINQIEILFQILFMNNLQNSFNKVYLNQDGMIWNHFKMHHYLILKVQLVVTYLKYSFDFKFNTLFKFDTLFKFNIFFKQ